MSKGSDIAEAHARLVDAREAVLHRDWVASRVAELTQERSAATGRADAARAEFSYDEDLEDAVMALLGRVFSPTKRADWAREKAQPAGARLAHEEAEAALDEVDDALGEYRAALDTEADADDELQAAADELAELVKDADPEWAAQLDALAATEAWLRHQATALEESLAVGGEANDWLDDFMASLGTSRSAEIGSSIAAMLSGAPAANSALGNVSDAMLDDIRTRMGALRHALYTFQRAFVEARDVEPAGDAELAPLPAIAELLAADFLGWHILELIDHVTGRLQKLQDDAQLAYSGLRQRRESIDALLAETAERTTALLSAVL